jgi:hypothetical protein
MEEEQRGIGKGKQKAWGLRRDCVVDLYACT